MAMKFTESLRNNETGEETIYEGDEAVIVTMCTKSDNPDYGNVCSAVCASPLTFAGWLNTSDFARRAVTVANLCRVLDPLAEALDKEPDDDEGAKP